MLKIIVMLMLSCVAGASIIITLLRLEALHAAAQAAADAADMELAAIICALPLIYRRAFGERKVRGGNSNYDLVCQKMERKAPKQFAANFRMSVVTFRKIYAHMWAERLREFNLAKRERKSQGQNAGGRPPNARVFRRRLYMTLWFLANGCSYRAVSEQFGCSCNFDVLLIRQISQLAPQFVVFPFSEEDVGCVAKEFRLLRGFRHCLGAIDGTFIRILAPWKSGRAKVC